MADGFIRDWIGAAVQDCKFSVTIADPSVEDCPLIAVSSEFEAMTGYAAQEVIGTNMRFMSNGCSIPPEALMGMRSACMTGAPFTAIIENRKRSGELFYNLLDLRGLVVAQDLEEGKDVWFVVAIQADVTDVPFGERPKGHMRALGKIALEIRKKLTGALGAVAISAPSDASGNVPSRYTLLQDPSSLCLRWRPGDQQAPRFVWPQFEDEFGRGTSSTERGPERYTQSSLGTITHWQEDPENILRAMADFENAGMDDEFSLVELLDTASSRKADVQVAIREEADLKQYLLAKKCQWCSNQAFGRAIVDFAAVQAGTRKFKPQ
eukprot:CAMPEP_0117555544 /NCGR_PEP_ID=MMETSP0784-20121206/51329_1 /TAXON_ID=39447 /ORGANISM="" /LENGTH=321 /DNA_ID=CAMNT_0005352753 /DNA_START=72 /DNA_END=1035 /DNA_ORIENTATION=+